MHVKAEQLLRLSISYWLSEPECNSGVIIDTAPSHSFINLPCFHLFATSSTKLLICVAVVIIISLRPAILNRYFLAFLVLKILSLVMSSLGKITGALASATNELTVAAANFNFDFSIMKVEAPTEFQPLGKGLSEQRRDDAENGIPHVTAQKLGALFKDIPPHTPELVKAYGNRVSEISQIPAAHPQTLVSKTAFANHAGADGTSIWAAATSGPGALPIQLLTCMLARLWTGPEATSGTGEGTEVGDWKKV